MLRIDARTRSGRLCEAVKEAGDCEVVNCLGERYIGCGMDAASVMISGVPGNALGAYLDGARLEVFGNAQDETGDTMNAGLIIIHGSVGDAAGYAMRGGDIFVSGDAGYRAGIHMKEYREHRPSIIIGGRAGSFLGEYQAGGVIIVLGLGHEGGGIVGDFPCTGMHGGKMYLRGDCSDIIFPSQVTVSPASPEDIETIGGYVSRFCSYFGFSESEIMASPFTAVKPDSKNPYRQMYVEN